MIDLGLRLWAGKWHLDTKNAFKNPQRLARFIVNAGTNSLGDFKLPVDNDLAIFVHDHCPPEMRNKLPMRARRLAQERNRLMAAAEAKKDDEDNEPKPV